MQQNWVVPATEKVRDNHRTRPKKRAKKVPIGLWEGQKVEEKIRKDLKRVPGGPFGQVWLDFDQIFEGERHEKKEGGPEAQGLVRVLEEPKKDPERAQEAPKTPQNGQKGSERAWISPKMGENEPFLAEKVAFSAPRDPDEVELTNSGPNWSNFGFVCLADEPKNVEKDGKSAVRASPRKNSQKIMKIGKKWPKSGFWSQKDDEIVQKNVAGASQKSPIQQQPQSMHARVSVQRCQC